MARRRALNEGETARYLGDAIAHEADLLDWAKYLEGIEQRALLGRAMCGVQASALHDCLRCARACTAQAQLCGVRCCNLLGAFGEAFNEDYGLVGLAANAVVATTQPTTPPRRRAIMT